MNTEELAAMTMPKTIGTAKLRLFGNLADHLGMLRGHLPNHKKCGMGTLGGERGQDGPRGTGHRAIVERQNHFARYQQFAIAERRAKPGTPARIDLDDPCDAKRIRGACLLCLRRR